MTGMYLQLVYGECIDRYIIRYTVIYRDIIYIYISWHILGDRLIPLASLSLVGFYMWAPLKV